MGAQAVVPVLCTAFVSGSPEEEPLKAAVKAAIELYLNACLAVLNVSLEAQTQALFEIQSFVWALATEAAADSGGDDDEEEDTTPVFPKELLPFLFHTLYDLNVISEEAFSEWVKADRMTPGWAECKAEADEWLKWLL